MRVTKGFLLAILAVIGAGPVTARADEQVGVERASGETLATAVGHYSRARSLLIAAIREFDLGYKLANPNVLLDSAQWRANLVDRAQELDRVLDPQPRASRSGIKYQADTRLLNEAKQ